MKTSSQSLPLAKEPMDPQYVRSKGLFIAGISFLLLLLLVDFTTIGRQASWQDEIYLVSTGWSLAQSKSPLMSVMEQYPRSDSPIQFYGPVSFEVDAQLIRMLGLSLVEWRALCLVGMILTLLVSSALVKLAGGDRWAQLMTALIIGLAQSVNSNLPGRFDAVTTAFFLSGLLLLLHSINVGGRALLWGPILGGAFIGLALGSTPRSLTLCLAAAAAALLTAVSFGKIRKRFLVATTVMFATAVSVQTLLLLPWGMNSFSWYAYVKQATKGDNVNATSVAGQGTLDFGFRWHKASYLVFLLLLLTWLIAALAQRGRGLPREKIALRFFLTAFAAANLSLMLLLLAQALGQSSYWLPPVVIGVMCWFDWQSIKAKAFGPIVAALVGACLSVLVVQNAENFVSVMVTWNRRSNADLTNLVRRSVQPGAVVYGPVSGYFYPVELAGARYLYLSEQARAGRFSEPDASMAAKLEEEICAHPTYAIWPETNPANHSEGEPMPEALSDRLLPKVAELDQPGLSVWKEELLGHLSPVAGKYGFQDVAIYPLKSLGHCGKG